MRGRHIHRYHHIATSSHFTSTSRKLGQLLYFELHYPCPGSKFRLMSKSRFTFVNKFPGQSFKWGCVWSTYDRQLSLGWIHTRLYTTCEKYSYCKWHFPDISSGLDWTFWRRAFTLERSFLVTFKLLHQIGSVLSTALARNQDENTARLLGLGERIKKLPFPVYLWNLCQGPDLISNHFRGS